ncbi:MAG: alanine racemase [Eubacteriales bacterium]|nr:alanine racemase [Eubacteriales bacterium]
MESTLKRTWAEIDLDALKNNYLKLRERIGSKTKFLAVVKADAYGHGSVQVSRLMQELGADYLAVSNIDEAIELRHNEITMPILILGHTPKEQVSQLIRYGITQAVTCRAKAIEYSEAAVAEGGILKIHVKVDTGMSRLGFLCDNENFETGIDGICESCGLPGLYAEGIFTHFAVSDEADDDSIAYTKKQFGLFTDVIKSCEERLGVPFAIRHCANTGAVANYPETWLDMVRPGLLLYGYGEFAEGLGLKPVMTLKTNVSTIKYYPEGTYVGYGCRYRTNKWTRMGVIPYGYADGFFRCLSNNCTLMTSEGPVSQCGSICMDMATIDLTDKPGVDVGSDVEIFGKHNPIEVMASKAGTIPYELTCAVSKRVPRVYLRNGEIIEKELLLRG